MTELLKGSLAGLAFGALYLFAFWCGREIGVCDERLRINKRVFGAWCDRHQRMLASIDPSDPQAGQQSAQLQVSIEAYKAAWAGFARESSPLRAKLASLFVRRPA